MLWILSCADSGYVFIACHEAAQSNTNVSLLILDGTMELQALRLSSSLCRFQHIIWCGKINLTTNLTMEACILLELVEGMIHSIQRMATFDWQRNETEKGMDVFWKAIKEAVPSVLVGGSRRFVRGYIIPTYISSSRQAQYRFHDVSPRHLCSHSSLCAVSLP